MVAGPGSVLVGVRRGKRASLGEEKCLYFLIIESLDTCHSWVWHHMIINFCDWLIMISEDNRLLTTLLCWKPSKGIQQTNQFGNSCWMVLRVLLLQELLMQTLESWKTFCRKWAVSEFSWNDVFPVTTDCERRCVDLAQSLHQPTMAQPSSLMVSRSVCVDVVCLRHLMYC